MVRILHTRENPFTWTDRFAHVSIIAYMQIFAHVCKPVHVKAPLDETVFIGPSLSSEWSVSVAGTECWFK